MHSFYHMHNCNYAATGDIVECFIPLDFDPGVSSEFLTSPKNNIPHDNSNIITNSINYHL